MAISFDTIQGNRATSALSAELTPLSLNSADKSAVFAGSGGKEYKTTLDHCSCEDFAFSLRSSSPCKHMIRLAMELGVFPREGMESDIDEAIAKLQMGKIEQYIKSAPIVEAMDFVRMLQIAREQKKGFNACDWNVRGKTIEKARQYPALSVSDEGARIELVKKHKKTLDSHEKMLLNRIASLVGDHLDFDGLRDLLAAFETGAVS